MDDDQRTPDIIVPQPEARSEGDEDRQEIVEHPAKLLRIASMIRELLEEARHSAIDEGGRKRLREIYDRALAELKDVLTEDLRRELDSLAVPFSGTPTESEIRVAQAQLVGWLEGLFHGIQAALWAQQMQARQQLEEMRRRGLPSGVPGQQPPQPPPGQYL